MDTLAAQAILSAYHALVEQTCPNHARDVICQRFGINHTTLSRLIVSDAILRSCPEPDRRWDDEGSDEFARRYPYADERTSQNPDIPT